MAISRSTFRTLPLDVQKDYAQFYKLPGSEYITTHEICDALFKESREWTPALDIEGHVRLVTTNGVVVAKNVMDLVEWMVEHPADGGLPHEDGVQVTTTPASGSIPLSNPPINVDEGNDGRLYHDTLEEMAMELQRTHTRIKAAVGEARKASRAACADIFVVQNQLAAENAFSSALAHAITNVVGIDVRQRINEVNEAERDGHLIKALSERPRNSVSNPLKKNLSKTTYHVANVPPPANAVSGYPRLCSHLNPASVSLPSQMELTLKRGYQSEDHLHNLDSPRKLKRPRLDEGCSDLIHHSDRQRQTILDIRSEGEGTDQTYSDSNGTERDFVDEPFLDDEIVPWEHKRRSFEEEGSVKEENLLMDEPPTRELACQSSRDGGDVLERNYIEGGRDRLSDTKEEREILIDGEEGDSGEEADIESSGSDMDDSESDIEDSESSDDSESDSDYDPDIVYDCAPTDSYGLRKGFSEYSDKEITHDTMFKEESETDDSQDGHPWRTFSDFVDEDPNDSDYHPPSWDLEDIWELEQDFEWLDVVHPLFEFHYADEIVDCEGFLTDGSLSTDDPDEGYHDFWISQQATRGTFELELTQYARSLGPLLVRRQYQHEPEYQWDLDAQTLESLRQHGSLGSQYLKWKDVKGRLAKRNFSDVDVDQRLADLLESDHPHFYFDENEWVPFAEPTPSTHHYLRTEVSAFRHPLSWRYR